MSYRYYSNSIFFMPTILLNNIPTSKKKKRKKHSSVKSFRRWGYSRNPNIPSRAFLVWGVRHIPLLPIILSRAPYDSNPTVKKLITTITTVSQTNHASLLFLLFPWNRNPSNLETPALPISRISRVFERISPHFSSSTIFHRREMVNVLFTCSSMRFRDFCGFWGLF